MSPPVDSYGLMGRGHRYRLGTEIRERIKVKVYLFVRYCPQQLNLIVTTVVITLLLDLTRE